MDINKGGRWDNGGKVGPMVEEEYVVIDMLVEKKNTPNIML
jgi:hypothetical protein